MFPIKDNHRLGYLHGSKTFYNAAHIGIDILVPEMTPLYAPESGRVTRVWGIQGGQWLYLDTGRARHRFAHLKQYNIVTGQQVKRGDIIALTGGAKGAWYSGNSTAPHVHWDISYEGRYVDPLTYNLKEDLETVRKGINQNFRNQFKREPIKDDNSYWLSRIGQPEPFGINSSMDLIDKMKYWNAQGEAAWKEERKKVLNKK
jgi:murein DD-endopeptidase MepM/ murein hydrolase activator NlpD